MKVETLWSRVNAPPSKMQAQRLEGIPCAVWGRCGRSCTDDGVVRLQSQLQEHGSS